MYVAGCFGLSKIEANIDFPDDDLKLRICVGMALSIAKCRELQELIDSARVAKYIGWDQHCYYRRPNVGKPLAKRSLKKTGL